MAGRFAPSPTGELHLGNLRTALVAWLSARAAGVSFLVRMEDLDRVTSSVEHEQAQLADLGVLGLHHDGDVVRQSERFAHYEAAIGRLHEQGLVYECYCTRAEIRTAASAPHGPEGAYPGTCRSLDDHERAARRAAGQRPALRLRTDGQIVAFADERLGELAGAVDDVVLRRGDGVPAYNLAVVVDDALQGVTQVIRADDLVPSTPRQVLLQRLLGLPTPAYLHVPLVVGDDGVRLAKRHGAVTMRDLAAAGTGPDEVLSMLATSLGLARPGERIALDRLVERFDPAAIPPEPIRLADLQRSHP